MNDKRADVRYRVAGSYERMLGKEQRPCCVTPTSARGYEQAELTALPTDALVNALGCGSPVTSSHLDPGDVVLDLGCGAGIDLLLAASKVGPAGRVIGVDMAGAMIRRARSNIAAAGLDNVEVHPGTIENLPIADGSVDWVISNCVINLSPEKSRVFAEVARVLKAGGGMRVVDIVAETLPEWVRHNDMLYDSCIAGAISEMDYVAGLRDADLTDIALGGRYVYDRDQLVALGAGALASSADADRLANALVGRVWSVYISARKPLQRTPRRHREV
jgi:SAM-dependent methyltransferase